MATKGQTHQKRARETARRERRELKQAKKEARAAGEVLTPDDETSPVDGDLETSPDDEDSEPSPADEDSETTEESALGQ